MKIVNVPFFHGSFHLQVWLHILYIHIAKLRLISFVDNLAFNCIKCTSDLVASHDTILSNIKRSEVRIRCYGQ